MIRVLVASLLIAWTAGCASSYKTQNYAKLSNTKDFEEEYSMVWKGIVSALDEYKIENKDSEKGQIQTDWVYSTSNDKYIEYQVNGFPRKKYLQTRYKFKINADKQLGHVRVTVNPQEEVENLKSDGNFDSWKSVSEPDSTRSNEILRNIDLKILSRPEGL